MKRVVIDPSRCTACKTCELQCMLAHSTASSLIDMVLRGEKAKPRVRLKWVPELNYPVKCMHCTDAPCEAACPVRAISIDSTTGAVIIDSDRCIGCYSCLMVCPFGAVTVSPASEKAFKCDSCIDRLRAGEEPACAAGCPTGALSFVELDEYSDATALGQIKTLRSSAETAREKGALYQALLSHRKEVI